MGCRNESAPSEWSPPLSNLKLNTDAAVKMNVGHIRIGGTIRDVKGLIVAGFSKPLVGCFSGELGKFLAFREGLQLAKQRGLKMGWAKSDTVNIVSTVNSVDRNFGVYGVVVDDIKVLYSESSLGTVVDHYKHLMDLVLNAHHMLDQ
ncbi:hypothetical protein JRO89_XS03G0225700 [Xanthoceras sorbifolium]|uniref:RNase H type-1 domain-containing protein n=1 Tax=Xanthoceras sorbifolium TaxID=99658 RepID=A0ABQ8IBH1_9ROSI|nr:hypothetical protein JRO89_XS03G0225700 [Xanthoceras sorbifolium]